MKKKQKKTIRLCILLCIVILIICLLFFGIKSLFKDGNVKKPIDVLEKYSYHLNSSASDYHKSLFMELKGELNKEVMDEKNYAEIISKIFLTDFFTLNNKTSKNDVGGVEFIFDKYQSDFKKYAKDSIYNFVESNFDSKRKQELPIVKEVEIVSSENKTHEYGDIEDKNAYFIELKIIYEKDLEYQTEVSLVLIHNNEKLEIVKMD